MVVAVVVIALVLTAGGAKRKARPKGGGAGLLLVLLLVGVAMAGAPDGGAGPADTGGLKPEMVDAIQRLEVAMGEPLAITSGYRSAADQARVCATGVRPCAPPGRSLHQAGLAVDVANHALAARTLLAHPEIPLCQPLPGSDPVHLSHRSGSEC